MTYPKQLFEFLCELIDVQIKKYTFLVKIGIGPDAGMNAVLVVKQVDELLQLAKELLAIIQNSTSSNHHRFETIFNQIQFYLNQEYLRGHAGWLLDENVIHNPEYARLQLQLQQLSDIGKSARISCKATPITTIQKQCEHDSHEIAFFILDIAVKLNQDPAMKLENMGHAETILRRHAQPGGRYHQEKFIEPIKKLHQQCKNYLAFSTLKKTQDNLNKADAKQYANEHKPLLENLLSEFRTMQPDSRLFLQNYQWHDISTRKRAQPSRSSHTLFGGCLLLAGIAIAAFIYHLSFGNDHSPNSRFNIF